MHGTLTAHTEARDLARMNLSAVTRQQCASCPVRSKSICAALCETDLAALSRISHPVRLQPKVTLVEEGDSADEVFSIVSGTVLLSKLLSDGRRQVIGFALPGDFIGLSVNDAHAFTAQSVDEVKACRVGRQALEEFMEHAPALARRLHQNACHDLAIAQDHMVLLGKKSASERVATFLLDHRSRWEKLGGASVRIDLPMTRQDMGDYLGVTVETVSRTLSGFAREGVLMLIPDGVRVLDLERLQAAAQG